MTIRTWTAAATLAAALIAAQPLKGEETDAATCEQQERAYEAMLACSRLLLAGSLEATQRTRIVALRGRAALTLFDFSGAVEDFTEVLSAEPDNIDVLAGRAEAHSYRGEHAKASDDWSRISNLKPDDIAARMQLGKSLNLAARHDKAVEAFNEVIKRDAANPEAFVGLAKAHDVLGNAREADDSVAAALRLNASYYPALMVQAEIAERRGDIRGAIESYLLAVKSNGMQVTPRRALQRLGVETPTPP